MHRTQILLEEEQYRFLTREARMSGVSLSGYLRRLIDERMSAEPERPSALDRIIGIGASEEPVAEEEHDRIIYGPDW